MSDWKSARIGDFVEIKHGFAFKGANITDEPTGDILVTPGNFQIGGGFKSTKFKYYKGKVPADYVLNANDIIVTMTDLSKESDTLGYSAKVPATGAVRYLHNQRIGLVQFFENAQQEIAPDFIYWLMRTYEYQGFIVGSASGSSIMHTSPSRIREYEFLLPTPPEQKAIASVLSSLDDKIELLHRQNKTLEAMAETLFRQWFVEEAQEDWETVKVGDFVKTNVSSITQGSKLKTIRYLDTGSLNEGKIEGFQILDIKDAPSRARRIVKHNDILISTVRPDQKHYGIIKNPDEDIIVSTGFCVISCKKINPHFIYILLTTKDMTEYLHSIAEASTSTYLSLKPSDIEYLEFKRPPEDSLRKFSAYADNAWDKIEYNHIQIRTLEKLRDTLLPKLMSGEVRVAI